MYTTQQRSDDENTIKISRQKPRNHQLFVVMVGRVGGRMHSPKDRNRQQEKRELRRLVQED